MTSISHLSEFINDSVHRLTSSNERNIEQASRRNRELTKPVGSLGRLEELAIWYSSWQGNAKRSVDSVLIAIFAGNHGVAVRGVSAYPSKVTTQMVSNFRAGGAAINQLARLLPATLKVVELDLERPTRDFVLEPAMTGEEVCEAFFAGWDVVSDSYDLVIPGEMGIGNTTSASALGYALFGGAVDDWVGLGTGITNQALQLKRDAVELGVKRYTDILSCPLEVLRCLGGRELVAIIGAVLSARMKRIPVILDGFICTAAAAVLYRIDPRLIEHAIAGHVSAEKGHEILLNQLGLTPLLKLDMRLGEGSGAAVAAHILRSAVACYGGMATFSEAKVSDKT